LVLKIFRGLKIALSEPYLNGVKKGVKKVIKKFANIIFMPLFCTRIRKGNGLNSEVRRFLKKSFLKKVCQKFGRLKKTLYLCTTFASRKSQDGDAKQN
jgi:hypothetical protein